MSIVQIRGPRIGHLGHLRLAGWAIFAASPSRPVTNRDNRCYWVSIRLWSVCA